MLNENDTARKEAQELESPHGEYRVNGGRVIRCLVIAGVMCLASLSFIVLGSVVAFPEPSLNKRVMTILVGACGVVLSLLLFASNWKKYGQQVVVFSEGFRCHQGGQWSVVLWDDIAAVWRHSSTFGTSRVLVETDLWIQLKNGQTIYLTSFFVDMARLVEVVLMETARRMVPAMSSQLQHGQTVDFGIVSINSTEIIASGKALGWGDVLIRVAHGAIDVQRKGDTLAGTMLPSRRCPITMCFWLWRNRFRMPGRRSRKELRWSRHAHPDLSCTALRTDELVANPELRPRRHAVAYFQDLTPYTYFPGAPTGMVNVGWLDFEHPFPIGSTSRGFRNKLVALSSKPVRQTRGVHFCDACKQFQIIERKLQEKAKAEGRLGPDIQELHDAWEAEYEGMPLPFGSAELNIAGKGSIIYAAPVMVAHYVLMHDYRPPDEFIEAVLACEECVKVELLV